MASAIFAAFLLLVMGAIPAVGQNHGMIEFGPDIQPGGAGITGTVKDNVTGELIVGMLVSVFNQTGDVLVGSSTTNNFGEYFVAAADNGVYNLTFEAMDYELFSVSGINAVPNNTTTLDVRVDPLESVLQGTVKESLTETPLADIKIDLYMPELGATDAIYSDSNGFYTYTTRARHVEIQVDTYGYEPYHEPNVFVPINSTYTWDIYMDMQYASIHGVVKEKSGEPISGASLKFTGFTTVTLTSNETGYYWASLGWGSYQYRVSTDRYFDETGGFTLDPQANLAMDFEITRMPDTNVKIEGHVKDKTTSMPIEGAMVCLEDQDLHEEICTWTNVGGYWSLDVYGGFFEITVSAAGYQEFKGLVSLASDEELHKYGDILLDPLPAIDSTLFGYVLDAGVPVPDATVTVFDGDLKAAGPVMTNATGYYETDIYAGTFDVAAKASGFFDTVVTDVAVSGNTKLNITLNPVPSLDFSVWGYVKDMDEDFVSMASVMLYDTDPAHTGMVLSDTTTVGGYYNIPVYAGDFLFVVDADGYQAEIEELTVSADVSKDVVLDESGVQDVEYTIEFTHGWTNVTFTIMMEIETDVRLVRWAMDRDFGNGDMTVSSAEADAWLAKQIQKGVPFKSTKNRLILDDVIFNYVEGTFDGTVEGANTTVADDNSFVYTTTSDFVAADNIMNETHHDLEVNTTFDGNGLDYSYKVTLPEGWEARNITSEYVSVSGTFEVLLDPPEAETGLAYEVVVINTTGNSAPVADAGKDFVLKVKENHTFDASDSEDDYGIVNYTWDFGDGSDTAYTVEVKHNFTLPTGVDDKIYVACLTVRDTAGLENSTCINVTVDGKPPTAKYDTNLTSVKEDGFNISFDASESEDNVEIDNYTWEFGDGSFGYGVKINHSWNQPGEYNVTLNVTDKAGYWATSMKVITVLDTTDPLAKIDVKPGRDVKVDQNLTFNGSRSTDNVEVVKWTWDFNDGNTGQGEEVNHTYTAPGVYEVNLTVEDAAGNKNTTSVEIKVTEEVEPPDLTVSDIKFEPSAPWEGDKVKIKALIENVGEGDANDLSIRFLDGSQRIETVRHVEIPAHESKWVEVEWTAVEGKRKITVEADPDNRYGEIDEENNKKSETVEVGMNIQNVMLIIGVIVLIVLVIGYLWWRGKKRREKDKAERRKKRRHK
jgi:PKD repeat protein